MIREEHVVHIPVLPNGQRREFKEVRLPDENEEGKENEAHNEGGGLSVLEQPGLEAEAAQQESETERLLQ